METEQWQNKRKKTHLENIKDRLKNIVLRIANQQTRVCAGFVHAALLIAVYRCSNAG